MRTRKFILSVCVALVPMTLAFGAGGDEKAVRDANAAWSDAAAAKDLEKTLSYYADDAVVLPAHQPAAATKAAIRNLWTNMMAIPGLEISWKASNVEIAKSGEMAYLHGTYQFSANDASGKPVPDHGKYLVVWKKQASGNWKVAADIWNSDLRVPAQSPAPGAAEKK